MKRLIWILGVFSAAAPAHDIITTPITFTREISRIFQARCWSCHRPGGTAFSLMTYSDTRPWAEAVKEEVLGRTMPPWGAIKGFGDFRNDQALTPEQIEVIENWADGGAPEGEPADLPPGPPAPGAGTAERPHGAIDVSGDFKLTRPFTLDGLLPITIPDKAVIQITLELPDGGVEPLLWLQDYKTKFAHPFLLREPRELPAGTVIRGVPPDARIALLPAESPNTQGAGSSPAPVR